MTNTEKEPCTHGQEGGQDIISVGNMVKKNCDQRANDGSHSSKQKVNKAGLRQGDYSSSDSESMGLMVCHVLSATANRTNSWIVDFRATCHMQ